MSDPVTVATDKNPDGSKDAVQPSPSPVVPTESQAAAAITETATPTTEPTTDTKVTSRTLGCQKMPIKAFCGLARCSITTNLQDCSACKEIRYCGKEHQTEHFKEGHKLVCQGRAKGAPLKFQECVDKASSYFERKMWVAALPYYAAILELTERGLGVFHPQTMLALEGMCTCYGKQEKFNEQSECLTRIITTKELYNDSSLECSKDLYNLMGRLAEALTNAGNLELAKSMIEKTEAEAEKSFGAESFERGKAMMALAICCEREGKVDEASTLMKKALAISGYGSPTEINQKLSAASGYSNLGQVLLAQNNFTEAASYLEKAALFRVQGGLPRDHPDLIEVKTLLVNARKGMA